MSTTIQRTEDRGQRTVQAGWVRRALIRNDEALVELLAPLAAEAAFGDERDFEDARAIAGRLSAIGRRLQLRRLAADTQDSSREMAAAQLIS